jgi:hypothetical protein
VDEEQLKAVTVGDLPPQYQEIVLEDYNVIWPHWYESAAWRIRRALGDTALEIHHVGSTAVRGLAAKPLIDVNLVVPDTTDEAAYVPPLEAIGYELRIREPDWYEHRLLRGFEPPVNLHVFNRLRGSRPDAPPARLAPHTRGRPRALRAREARARVEGVEVCSELRGREERSRAADPRAGARQ